MYHRGRLKPAPAYSCTQQQAKAVRAMSDACCRCNALVQRPQQAMLAADLVLALSHKCEDDGVRNCTAACMACCAPCTTRRSVSMH